MRGVTQARIRILPNLFDLLRGGVVEPGRRYDHQTALRVFVHNAPYRGRLRLAVVAPIGPKEKQDRLPPIRGIELRRLVSFERKQVDVLLNAGVKWEFRGASEFGVEQR